MKTLSLAASCLLVSGLAFADVTIRTKAESGGYKGMGAFESENLRKVQGVKARDEGTFKFTGAILGAFGRKKSGGPEILRVDLDKRWTLDTKKKKYAESSISRPPEEESEKEPEPEGKGEKGEPSKPTHRIKKTTFDVKKTADKKEINGFQAQRWSVEFAMEVEEIETKQVATYKMLSDQWLTPWTKTLRAAVEEEAKFGEAYLKKLGVEISLKDRAALGVTALQMLTQAGGPELQKTLADVKRKTEKLDGFAVRTETRWLAAAPKGAAAANKKKEPEPEEDEELDVSNGVGGLLGGLAKKAASKKAKKMAEDRSAAQEGKPAFTSTTEVLAVSTTPIDKSEFEIPEGYKKK